MKQKFDFKWVRIAASILIYVAMFGLLTFSTYALVVGPQRFGIDESWPLVFYFVVAYLDTLLLGLGIFTVIREGPGILRHIQ